MRALRRPSSPLFFAHALYPPAPNNMSSSSSSPPPPVVNSTDDYEFRSVLVTGGSGFSASHVVELLVARYPHATIVNLDRLDYCASELNCASVANAPNYRFVRGDVGDRALVAQVLDRYAVDTVLHFAAQTHVDNSFGDGSAQFSVDNVVATHVLLECVKRRLPDVKRFVLVSTDEVYGGEHEHDERDETAPFKPTNPYAASKAGAELQAQAYMMSYGVPLIVTRGNNVYGPRQYPEKVIPRFVMQLLRDEPCTVHGDGSTRRTFAHVDDVARAFDVVLRRGVVGEAYNIGGVDQISVAQLARRLVALIKPNEPIERWLTNVADRAFNDREYRIRSSKLEALGWRPQVSFDDGLRGVIEWYRANGAHWWAVTPSNAKESQ